MNLVQVVLVVYVVTIVNMILFGLILRSEVKVKLKEDK
jgi:hypothetical protein